MKIYKLASLLSLTAALAVGCAQNHNRKDRLTRLVPGTQIRVSKLADTANKIENVSLKCRLTKNNDSLKKNEIKETLCDSTEVTLSEDNVVKLSNTVDLYNWGAHVIDTQNIVKKNAETKEVTVSTKMIGETTDIKTGIKTKILYLTYKLPAKASEIKKDDQDHFIIAVRIDHEEVELSKSFEIYTLNDEIFVRIVDIIDGERIASITTNSDMEIIYTLK